jgi:hypothetical protein
MLYNIKEARKPQKGVAVKHNLRQAVVITFEMAGVEPRVSKRYETCAGNKKIIGQTADDLRLRE